MIPPETRPSLLLQIRDPANNAAWDEFSEICRPVITSLVKLNSEDCTHTMMQHWVYVLSSDDVYRASLSSPREHARPPVDPVLLLTVLKSLVGENETFDHRTALFFREEHPARMLNRHIDDILSGTRRYRGYVLETPVTIYRKSKSEELKSAIARLAPGVPVEAEEVESGTE